MAANCPDRHTPGQYVFAPQGTPHFPGFHNLWSATWTTDDRRDDDGLGEVQDSRYGWFNGALPAIVPDAVRIGSLDCIRVGEQVECVSAPELTADDGAEWSEVGDGLRLSFEDSLNCGGSNDSPQFGRAVIRLHLLDDHSLICNLSGRTERQNADFDVGRIVVDGNVVAQISGTGEQLGCMMGDHSTAVTVQVGRGDHVVELIGNTVDGLYHVGAYFDFQITLDPPPRENTNTFQEGFDRRCFLPTIPPHGSEPVFPDVFDRDHQLVFAQALELQYTDGAAAQNKLDSLLGTFLKAYRRPNDTTAQPGLNFAEYDRVNVVMISGTTNDLQWALHGMGIALGPRRFAQYSTSAFWVEQQQIMQRQLFAFQFDLSKPFLFIGHSYGAVLATLSVADYLLAAPARDIQLFTCGMPRPGDPRLARILRFARSCHMARVDDPVPGLPPNTADLAPLFGLIPQSFYRAWSAWESPPGCYILHEDGREELGTPPGPGVSLLIDIALAIVAGDPVGPFAGHLIDAYVAALSTPP